MSGWGLKDNVVATGTVTVADDSANVNGFNTVFLLEVDPGDYVGIAGTKYQVDKVESNVFLTLTSLAATNSDNVAAYIQQGPKYVSNVALDQNVYSIQSIIGVDSNEAIVESNKLKGLKTPGWNHHMTWEGGHGQTRFRSECLVAMSKNFRANISGDWDDDATVLDYFIYFTVQPTDQSKAANSNVTLRAAALSEPVGASLTYQWSQSPNNIVFANVADGGVFSGATANTLQVSNIANVDNTYFKLTVSSAGVADSNVSDTIIVTHLA